jgi:uncharacterized repeat protein (TIGR03803 family)
MHSQARSLSSLFRTISLVMIAVSVMAVAMFPAWAQNSVPPTAVQAAKMPQYASRLAHPAGPVTSPKSPALQRAKQPRSLLDSDVVYDNGPINGRTDAWYINFGFIVSDSFYVAGNQTPISGMSFGAWLFPGDTLTSVEISITALENGGTSYFDQTVNLTQGSCSNGKDGFRVCPETGSFTGPILNAGTYWVNLQNASVPSGDPAYWDENSGTGCPSQGCPSLASANSIGSIPSESFTILGSVTTTTGTYYQCPEQQNGFHDLNDFPPGYGPSGVVANAAGGVYGTFTSAGNYAQGLLYDLTQRAGNWFLSGLYSFLGGSQGSSPNGVIVGPQGILYGAANGGMQNCGNGSDYCGLIYEARPRASVCPTALCSWNETTVYQFTGNSDAWNGNVAAFDSAGNLYGISGSDTGAYGAGAVFELTPSSGNWTETILYSFTGGSDGSEPNSLLVGTDGNLYGTTQYGGLSGRGVVFQLVPAGGTWTENVIHAFTGGATDGWGPSSLIEDGTVSLYGLSTCYNNYNGGCADQGSWTSGVVFGLAHTASGWVFTQAQVSAGCWGTPGSSTYHALTRDSAGNLYATEGGVVFLCDSGPAQCYSYCGAIDKVNGGSYPLVGGWADIFGNITSDANGNLYGTTSTCGFESPQRNTGMVWQYSP